MKALSITGSTRSVKSNLAKFPITFTISFMLSLQSCEEFVEIGSPRNEITTQNVFETDETAVSAIRGLYSIIMSNNNSGFAGGGSGISLLAGLSADEMATVTSQNDFYTNSLSPTNAIVKNSLWDVAFNYIYNCNSILEGLAQSETLTEFTRKQLRGEALFMRAFFYYYLVNLYGDVPLATSTDYQANSLIARSSVNDVYNRIVSDLQQAVLDLPNDFSSYGNLRIRPTQPAAYALLARVSLHQNQWEQAEKYASLVIDNPLFSLSPDLDNVFLANSPEAILQFYPTVPGYNTWDGGFLIPSVLTSRPSYTISNYLIDDFESGDQRYVKWVKSFSVGVETFYYPVKYKVRASSTVSEYFMVLRVAEQLLIRAEAMAHQGKVADAVSDLDLVRSRAGLQLLSVTNPTITQQDLLKVIAHEKRIEFFIEWGHRWIDLKRSATVDEVMSLIKGNLWQQTDIFYPIPQVECDRNPNMIQNSGY